DLTVTGVQTCALPISPPLRLPIGNVYAMPTAADNATDNIYTWSGNVWWLPTQNGSVRIDAAIMTTCGLLLEAVPIAFRLAAPPRSEERRVGKECSTRG